MGIVFWLIVLALTLFVVSKVRLSLPVATIAGALILFVASTFGMLSGFFGFVFVAICVVAAVVFNVRPLRQRFVSLPVLKYVRAVLPPMSETERAAIDAGTVWWEAELFRGAPDYKKLLAYPEAALNTEEQAFVDVQTDKLCELMNDWQITYELNDLPEDVWDYIKRERFLGMVIPKEYGGLGFSAMAHSEVVTKLATRSVTGAVSVMVPNSLARPSCCCTTEHKSRKTTICRVLQWAKSCPVLH